MTLDQVLMLLTDRDLLLRREKKIEAAAAGTLVDSDGMIAGRADDGSPIRGKIRGKSVARQLMEEQEKQRMKENKKQKRRRRR